MKLRVINDTCMCCGTKEGLTIHHAIPSRMKPLENIEITLCGDCHKQLHRDYDQTGVELKIRSIKNLELNIKQ